MMRTRLAGLTIALSLIGAGTASAQVVRIPADFAGYIGMGRSWIGTEELDDRLAARGIPTFGQDAVGVNLGWYVALKSGVMLGAEWHGLILPEQEHEGQEVWLGGGYGTLGIGYAVDVNDRLRVYPRLGLGGGGFGLTFDNGADSISFDDVLADPDGQSELNPPRRPTLSHAGPVMDLGAGADYRFGRRGTGALIGLRVGYVLSPASTDWWLNEHKVSGGPEASIAGPYVRVLIGMGRRR